MNEFSLIDQFFKPFPIKRKDVLFGIGDDAACMQIPSGSDLLVSTDTLVAGIHFLPEWNAYDIAYKSVMVNVSDMAAMAAEPCWVTLALTLPELNQTWLTDFAKGLNHSLNQFNIDLIGGDTTRGPLSITITIMGLAPHAKAIRRNGAKPGDIIIVSGQLGAAALAVKLLKCEHLPAEDKAELMAKLLHPIPRVDLIDLMREYTSAAIDISDGLAADLNHICVASGVGGVLNQEAIPLHPLLTKHLNKQQAVDLALTGGDDYEICFTVPEHRLDALLSELTKAKISCYPIGVIEEKNGLRLKGADGKMEELTPRGYSHF